MEPGPGTVHYSSFGSSGSRKNAPNPFDGICTRDFNRVDLHHRYNGTRRSRGLVHRRWQSEYKLPPSILSPMCAQGTANQLLLRADLGLWLRLERSITTSGRRRPIRRASRDNCQRQNHGGGPGGAEPPPACSRARLRCATGLTVGPNTKSRKQPHASRTRTCISPKYTCQSQIII